MNNDTTIGLNRTGMGTAPLLSKEMIENTQVPVTGVLGDGAEAAAVRESYARGAEPVGTVPPPSTLKGAASTAVQALKGNKMAVLLDKLGERLAFERAGTRLWEALLSKFDAYGTWAGGPARNDILAVAGDEAGHAELVRRAIEKLGADPTVMSPSADLTGVEGMGLVQVLTDPRTNLAQSLHAVLVAELVDNDGWAMLIDLADTLGQDELSASFVQAREAEARHLTLVRQWMVAHCRLGATGDLDQGSA